MKQFFSMLSFVSVLSLFSLLLSLDSFSVSAHEQVMDNENLDNLIKRFDAEAQGDAGRWQLKYENISIAVITDEAANRMRIIVQVTSAEQLEEEHFYQLMQANFDSALNARYAVASGIVWSTFIHPLSMLTEEEFYSGLAQVITLASTFGSTFSSGALVFRGGDSQEEHRKLYEDILRRGKKI